MGQWHTTDQHAADGLLFPPYPTTERREQLRQRVHLWGWLQLDCREIRDIVVLDLSFSGARIEMSPPPQLRDRLRFSIDMPSPMDEVWIDAVVRWIQGNQVGLFFPVLSLQAQRELQRAALRKKTDWR